MDRPVYQDSKAHQDHQDLQETLAYAVHLGTTALLALRDQKAKKGRQVILGMMASKDQPGSQVLLICLVHRDRRENLDPAARSENLEQRVLLEKMVNLADLVHQECRAGRGDEEWTENQE